MRNLFDNDNDFPLNEEELQIIKHIEMSELENEEDEDDEIEGFYGEAAFL